MAATAGFVTNAITRALRSSARRRGLARSASESTVAASWSRADVDLLLDGVGVAVRHVSILQSEPSMHLRHYPRSAGATPRSGEQKGTAR